MKYLIFGNGWLGNKFLKALPDSMLSTFRIENLRDVEEQIEKLEPLVVLNAVGKTGRPNVDWCEDHKDETFFSNVTVPQMIAEACEKSETYMVHLGSGCVYTGGPYKETDEPNFIDSYYSKTKVFSESILKQYKDVLIARLRMPFDGSRNPRSLITKLVSYKRVLGDVPNSVTYIPDLITSVAVLAEGMATGIYNITNQGSITHREILEAYQKVVDSEYKLPEFITVEELMKITKAPRSNCILDTEKLKSQGIFLRSAQGAVREALWEMKE